VRITHKVDYGVRALVALARFEVERPGVPVKRETLATQEAIPGKFLDDILRSLRNSSVVKSHRGPEGGWTLARPAAEITVADVIRVLEGPLASVRGMRPDELAADGVAEPFVSLWVAVRVSLRSVLEHVTLADLVEGQLPADVASLLDAPGAWAAR
jgi:Rrf2 family protein